MTAPDPLAPPTTAEAEGWLAPALRLDAGSHVHADSGWRDARTRGGEIGRWQPRLTSADADVLRDAPMLRARARDLVRNDPLAKNAVRMQRDAVSGSGLKLALKIDWRSLGVTDIAAAGAWQDSVVRAWEAHAESYDFECDARREMTFSQLFMLVDRVDFTDGEALAIVEQKPGLGPYQTCLNIIDIDRLSNPNGMMDGATIRGGIERDLHGAPLAYYIRNGHPADVGIGLESFSWQRVPRQTPWGRPIVLHTYDKQRAEMSRGVTEFASAIVPFRMLRDYSDTELQSAVTQAAFAAVIKTEMDWSQAMQVLGKSVGAAGTGNPLTDVAAAHMINSAKYHREADITFQGTQIPVLLPNEELEVVRPSHPNSNFADFETAFIRRLAAGLGVEAHELGKNYREVNYSAARAALLAVWRTYTTRRNRLVSQFAMPYFAAWLEEAWALGLVTPPDGASADFLAIKPYIVKGTFIAWGKPRIDPEKERRADQLGVQMGATTMEDIVAEDGKNWRDVMDQLSHESRYRKDLGLPDVMGMPILPPPPPDMTGGGSIA